MIGFTSREIFIYSTKYSLLMNIKAIAQLSSGAAPGQAHAYLVSVGDLQNVVVVLYSSQLVPGAAFRRVPKVKFKKGETLYVRGVQLSEATTAAAEATQLILNWA